MQRTRESTWLRKCNPPTRKGRLNGSRWVGAMKSNSLAFHSVGVSRGALGWFAIRSAIRVWWSELSYAAQNSRHKLRVDMATSLARHGDVRHGGTRDT